MRLTGEIMKIITCFKLVPEEQDIVVTPEYTLNFDNAVQRRVPVRCTAFSFRGLRKISYCNRILVR